MGEDGNGTDIGVLSCVGLDGSGTALGATFPAAIGRGVGFVS